MKAIKMFFRITILLNIFLFILSCTDIKDDENSSGVKTKITYEITFNQNGGSGNMTSQIVEENISTKLNSNTFIAPIGYKFSGWTTNNSGAGTSYCENDYIAISSNMTLYAIWVTTETYFIAKHNSINISGFSTNLIGIYKIPCGITGINGSAFCNCTSITNVIIPLSVTDIAGWAFAYCGISSVIIPESVTTMDINPFVNCVNLASISINTNNPKYCSDEQGCVYNKDKTILICAPSKLTTVEIPTSVTEIQDIAFYISKLNSITIPASVIKIGSSAFACTELKTVLIPANVSYIGDKAFFLSYLTTITIPVNVLFIGNNAFGANYLTSINVDFNNPNYTSINGVLYNKNGTTLLQYPTSLSGPYIIPSNVTSIDANAFISCNITSVTIPSSVNAIGNSAFFQCSSLSTVIIDATTPPTISANSEIFDRLPEFTIYVPAESVNTYRNEIGWNKYASHISSK
jgi:hypothetical protein